MARGWRTFPFADARGSRHAGSPQGALLALLKRVSGQHDEYGQACLGIARHLEHLGGRARNTLHASYVCVCMGGRWTGARASPQAARACAWVHVGRGCGRPLGQNGPPPALAHSRRGDLVSPQPWPVWREGLAEGGLGAKHGQLGIVCGADLSWENSQISQSDSHNQLG